jgi:hypothetical protein
MNVDALYSYLMSSSWLFLGGWALLIVSAAVFFFRGDSREPCVRNTEMRRN